MSTLLFLFFLFACGGFIIFHFKFYQQYFKSIDLCFEGAFISISVYVCVHYIDVVKQYFFAKSSQHDTRDTYGPFGKCFLYNLPTNFV